MEYRKLKVKLETGRRNGRVRYDLQMKREIVSCVRNEMAHGASKTRAVKGLGVGWDSFHRWATEVDAAGSSGDFAEVRVKQEMSVAETTVTLIAPNGWRIEGLSAEQAVTLLDAMS